MFVVAGAIVDGETGGGRAGNGLEAARLRPRGGLGGLIGVAKSFESDEISIGGSGDCCLSSMVV